MVPILSLWLPILLSALLVFVVSAILHMVLSYHWNDFASVPRETEVMTALRPFDIPPGEYFMPRPASQKEMGSPEHAKKLEEGPVMFMTVIETGPPRMGKALAGWFVYCLVVSLFAAYIAGRALPAGADYLEVFRFAGCTAFVGYALALWQNTIWYKRAVSTTLKANLDGLIYALLTAGVFGWLWP